MVDVEQWAEIRRMHKVAGLSIREIARRSGRDRHTVRAALRSEGPPRYRRGPRPSKIDPFKEEIHRLLKDDVALPSKRIREEIEEDGYEGGKTILDDYLREVRPRTGGRPDANPAPEGDVVRDVSRLGARLGVEPGAAGIALAVDHDVVVAGPALPEAGRVVSAGLEVLALDRLGGTSAWNCISQRLATAPPSAFSTASRSPAAASWARTASTVW